MRKQRRNERSVDVFVEDLFGFHHDKIFVSMLIHVGSKLVCHVCNQLLVDDALVQFVYSFISSWLIYW